MYKLLSLVVLMSLPAFGDIQNKGTTSQSDVTLKQVTQSQISRATKVALVVGTVGIATTTAPITTAILTTICVPAAAILALYDYLNTPKDTKETDEKK